MDQKSIVVGFVAPIGTTPEPMHEKIHRLKMNGKELWACVKQNAEQLQKCAAPQHDFSQCLSAADALNKKWRCIHCLGEVDHHAKRWYELGLAAAKR